MSAANDAGKDAAAERAINASLECLDKAALDELADVRDMKEAYGVLARHGGLAMPYDVFLLAVWKSLAEEMGKERAVGL